MWEWMKVCGLRLHSGHLLYRIKKNIVPILYLWGILVLKGETALWTEIMSVMSKCSPLCPPHNKGLKDVYWMNEWKHSLPSSLNCKLLERRAMFYLSFCALWQHMASKLKFAYWMNERMNEWTNVHMYIENIYIHIPIRLRFLAQCLTQKLIKMFVE